MEPVDAAGADGAADRGAAHSRGEQLRPGHDSVLLASNIANCLGSGSVSGPYPRQFGHAAMVGARRVPVLRE